MVINPANDVRNRSPQAFKDDSRYIPGSEKMRGNRPSIFTLLTCAAAAMLAAGGCGSLGSKNKTAEEPAFNGSCDVVDGGKRSYCIDYYGYADDQIKAEVTDPCAALTISTLVSTWSKDPCPAEAKVVGCKPTSDDPRVSAVIWYYEAEAASKVADSCKVLP